MINPGKQGGKAFSRGRERYPGNKHETSYFPGSTSYTREAGKISVFFPGNKPGKKTLYIYGFFFPGSPSRVGLCKRGEASAARFTAPRPVTSRN